METALPQPTLPETVLETACAALPSVSLVVLHPSCQECGRAAPFMMTCAECKRDVYCSDECLRRHLKRWHKGSPLRLFGADAPAAPLAQAAGCQRPRSLAISAAISAQLRAEAGRQRSQAISAEIDAAAGSQRSLAISAQLDAERDRQLDAQLDAMSDGSVDAVANPAVDFIPCETAVPGDTPSAAAQQAAPLH